jgi:hypothetical protein
VKKTVPVAWTWAEAQGRDLLSKCEALSSIPSPPYPPKSYYIFLKLQSYIQLAQKKERTEGKETDEKNIKQIVKKQK